MTYDERLEAATDLAASKTRGSVEFWEAVREAENRYDVDWTDIQQRMSERSAIKRHNEAERRKRDAEWRKLADEHRASQERQEARKRAEAEAARAQWEADHPRQFAMFDEDAKPGAIRR